MSSLALQTEQTDQSTGRHPYRVDCPPPPGHEVEEEVRRLGGTPEQSGSLSGTLHQGWIELKSIATGQDEGAMLNECALNEKMMLNKYAEVLRQSLPQNARLIMTRQQRLSKESLKHLEQLQEKAPYPGKLP